MSTAPSPSSETEPSTPGFRGDPRAVLVFHFQRHLDLVADEADVADRADLDAGDADRRARLEPGDIVEDGLEAIALPEEPSSPLSRKISVAAMTRATTVTMPIFSSDQASERVRGMTFLL